MAETLEFSEYALGTVTMVGTSSEAISFSESSSGMAAINGTSGEGLSFSERSNGAVTILGTVVEGIRFRESARGVLWGRSGEALLFSESSRGFSPISGTGRESIWFGEHCYGHVVDPVSDDTTAWCVNLVTGGHSRYTGPLDGSATVTGRVVTPSSQLGSDRAKHVPDLYLHGRLDFDLTVATMTDEQAERSYTLHEDGRQGMHRRRLKLARGVRGTNWQFIVSGRGFTLSSIEIPPVVSQRVR